MPDLYLDEGFLEAPFGEALRGLPISEIEADSEPLPSKPMDVAAGAEAADGPVRFRVAPSGEPQAGGTEYLVFDEDTGETLFAGKVLKFGFSRGLSRSGTLLEYDRNESEAEMRLWAHFIWPMVMAGSNGRYISINAWDCAHFAGGFHQLGDNLILLMRELVQLPSVHRHFPDLTLVDGKVARKTSSGTVPFEREELVQVSNGRTEMQLPDFMAHLNPTSVRVEEREVLTAAKFAGWALDDEAMRDATVRVSVSITKRKIKASAQMFGFIGKRPELAIWVSDIFHHGRGKASLVLAALAKPTFSEQLDAQSGRHDRPLRAPVRQPQAPRGDLDGRELLRRYQLRRRRISARLG
ncbi:hypothetical protein [Paracoccus actinidiae]|uniref:hypothetical protein n=1 Tax=Paracoccus actinidiae TaxID=3064531 RepID=UPI0027D2961F|nr:hypothetical protein [Paracoccus sp. M09]